LAEVTTPPEKTDIRAVCIDIDGTLVGPDERISPRVSAALNRARSHGIEIVIATGRSKFSTMPIARQIPPLGYGIVATGSVVIHLEKNTIVMRNVLSHDDALAATLILWDAGLAPRVYEDAIHSARILFHPDRPIPKDIAHRHTPWPELCKRIPFEPTSVEAFGTQDQMRPLAQKLRRALPPSMVVIESHRNHYWYVEICSLRAGKGQGLKAIAAHLGISPRNVMAIGDGLNDLDMIAEAGIGVAMGNALPEVQAAADYVTGTQAEDGVAEALEKWAL
jgi:Cof subfamily protein (haloacid dehalogenase superfamily)